MIELPLTELKHGEIGIISFIKTGHRRGHWKCPVFEKRLMEMGLTPSTEVIVVKSAPFNGPLEISVRGSRLALGRGMSKRILW
jgi:DtxR family Mn-dependent transcriptional regulator